MARTPGRAGGRRPGAGRKAGSKSPQKAQAGKARKSSTPKHRKQAVSVRETIEKNVNKALSKGQSPLEYFLEVMRSATKELLDEDGDYAETVEDWQRRDWAAGQAAAYVHARLQVKTIEGQIDHNVTFRWAKTEREVTA